MKAALTTVQNQLYSHPADPQNTALGHLSPLAVFPLLSYFVRYNNKLKSFCENSYVKKSLPNGAEECISESAQTRISLMQKSGLCVKLF